MKTFIRTVLLSAVLSVPALTYAQTLKGTISNESGNPVPYATVYIQELREGTTANAKGDYELKLPAGKYLVTYQSLGYSPVFATLTIGKQPIIRNVTLPMQYYQIPEVRISASGEDPAYVIMRKAIGMAPYYLNNINYYKAEVYLKGTLVINRIPKIMQKAMKVEARNDDGGSINSTQIKEGDVYLMESFNEIEFTAPDKYVQKVISVNSTFPEEGNSVSPMDLIQASFYEPVIADIAISPLSPQAFSYYNFRYEGATLQGNYTISKIKVEPKRKSQQVFEGTIYIIEDLWCLHSVDLSNENLAGEVRVEQLYIPVEEDIWLPVTHKFGMKIGVLGFKADAGYGSSVKYLSVKPNTTLKKPESVAEATAVHSTAELFKKEPEKSKNQQKIEEILEKPDLSNRDMLKLTKLMEKETEVAKPDSVKKELEIKDNTTRSIEKDAGKKDSLYWAEIRPIPLSDIEIKSIKVRDSIKNQNTLTVSRSDTSSAAKKPGKQKSKFVSSLGNVAFGHTWSDTTGLSFNFGGLLNADNLSFNTVDGFLYGTDFRLTKRWKNSNTLTISPYFKWAFAREVPVWRVNSSYNFDRMKQRSVYLRIASTSKDLQTGGSINTLINSFTSLFMKRNYLKLYESKSVFTGYRSEISNGLYLDLSAGYEYRRVLNNNTDFSFFNTSRSYTDNLPVNEYLNTDPLNQKYIPFNQRHFEFVTNVTYTPRQRYMIRGEAKIPRGSDWPTFNLNWKHGFSETAESSGEYNQFDMISIDASKRYETGAFSEFRWRVSTGGIINNSNITYYDFFHFNAQPLPVLLDDYQDVFRIPAYYSLSTPRFYAESHTKYTTPYLLLKYLPGLSNTLMRENISLSVLGTRGRPFYTELGYSISEISFFGELGVYAGFDKFKYRSIGVRLILKLG